MCGLRTRLVADADPQNFLDTVGGLHQRHLKVKLENVAIANALQLEVAQRRAVML